jgi:hypothetical protein
MMTTDTRPKSPGRCGPVECCCDSDCTCGLRNNFFEGKRLTPDMFRIEQRYAVERRRLLNRAIHGVGVVYGYGVTTVDAQRQQAPKERALTIRAGLALDKRGRELLEIKERELSFKQLILLDDNGRPLADKKRNEWLAEVFKKAGDPRRVCWLLRVHYAERPVDQVQVPEPCHCDRDEWDRTCETVRYSVQAIDCAKCCKDADCGLSCDCAAGACCGDPDPKAPRTVDQTSDRHPTHGRGGCRCLCDHLIGFDPGSECRDDLLREIEDCCGNFCVDLVNGVELACLKIDADGNDSWTFVEEVDQCGPRPLVKRNDLLFDLIRGCDLTRIKTISWAEWHRDQPMPFETLKEYFGKEVSTGKDYLTEFYVTFSRPVRLDTLRPDCFVMTVVTVERDDAWWETLRVPVVALDTDQVPVDGGTPAAPKDHVWGARLIVNRDWYRDVFDGYSKVFAYETRVEIEIRGDYIVDCNGQTVDANARGRSATTFGNGTPGGTFVSTLSVEPQAPATRTDPNVRERKGVRS